MKTRLLMLAGCLLTLLGSAGPAAAATAAAAASVSTAPSAGVGMSVTTSASSYPANIAPLLQVQVTNQSSGPCALAATSDLTLAVVSATRDGTGLVPEYSRAYPIDGAGSAVLARTSAVPPGGRVSFNLDTSGEHGLPVSVGLDDGSALTALWPLSAPGRYELQLSYAMPALDGSDPVCTGTSDPVTISFTIGGTGQGRSWTLLAVVAGGVLLLVVVAVLVWRRGRGRRAGTAAAALLLALAAVVGVESATSGRANAGVIYGPDPDKDKQIFNTYTGCLVQITQFDPGLMKALEGPTVVVYPWTDSSSRPKTGGSGKDSVVAWDPFKGGRFVGEPPGGAAYDPCSALYHELNHARDHAENKESNAMCDDTGVLTDEVRATLAENRFRAAQKPPLPLRTTYDGKKIPKSMDGCTPPKKPKKADNGGTDPGVCRGVDGPCASDNGDPHLSTYDHYRFDLQAVGEFVATRSASGDLEIQTRQSAFSGSRTVAVNTAVAMKVGGVRLGFYLDHGAVVVHRDGKVVSMPLGTTALAGGGRVNRAVDPLHGDAFAVVWPDGSAAWVTQVGRWGLVLSVQPRASRTGTLTGLLGPYDGDKSNDVSTVDGTKLTQPPGFDQLYHAYAQGWRVTDATSLFDYATGTTTKDFTDPSFPERPLDAAALAAAAREAARTACALLGVTDPGMLDDCVVDVASTGQALFAVDSLRVQTAAELGGPPAGDGGSANVGQQQTLPIKSGAILSFDGTAGERAFVDVIASTLRDGCGSIELDDDAGYAIGLGCLKGGVGYIDGTRLPKTGHYRVVADGVGTGSVTLRLTTSVDVVVPIQPDGPAVTGTTTAPGQLARFTFTATPGQKAFVEITGSTGLSGCGDLTLGEGIGTYIGVLGCVNAGDHTGFIDTSVLKEGGPYSIVVDPAGNTTGSATARLYFVKDQRQQISLNGTAVLATVSQPGAQSLLTFTGTAGQKVIIDGTGGSAGLHGCGPLELRDASGAELALGCIGADGTAHIDAVTLKVSGVYTVAFDPSGPDTGSISLRAHT